uniref:Uncharacterized protein n=1 Tax=Arundo donax TaxID=35708 RepID=A0A0A9TR37_ARUDO
MNDAKVPSSLGMVHSTLISRKGMRRLFSSLESRPSSLAACRKLRLVAASAFMAAQSRRNLPHSKERKKDHEAAAKKNSPFQQRAQQADKNRRTRREQDPGEPKAAREKAASLLRGSRRRLWMDRSQEPRGINRDPGGRSRSWKEDKIDELGLS